MLHKSVSIPVQIEIAELYFSLVLELRKNLQHQGSIVVVQAEEPEEVMSNRKVFLVSSLSKLSFKKKGYSRNLSIHTIAQPSHTQNRAERA